MADTDTGSTKKAPPKKRTRASRSKKTTESATKPATKEKAMAKKNTRVRYDTPISGGKVAQSLPSTSTSSPSLTALKAIIEHWEGEELIGEDVWQELDGGGRQASSVQAGMKNAAEKHDVGYKVAVKIRPSSDDPEVSSAWIQIQPS